MSKQEKSRKPLIVGIIAAVVILAVLLAVLLTQCVGGQTNTEPTTESTSGEVPTYQVYWNLDRAEYAGKSEAGMSSREPEADGLYSVRFFLDGEIVTLRVANRRLINAIDAYDVMGLEFDEDGVVVGVLDLDDMPLEKVGWQFYVQSWAKNMIKVNSSESLNGMEIMLENVDFNRIWDMTGKTGEPGCVSELIAKDRVMVIQNLAGEITHIFIFDRPGFMVTHEGYCEHCKEDVTWSHWPKNDQIPLDSGHYQLTCDVQLKGQNSIHEEAKLCLDLNGYRIDGKDNARAISMHNPAIEFAVMDTSEEQTGVIAAHGTSTQGMAVWVRYGAFYLYSGTIDASDAVSTGSGCAMAVPAGTFFYMYGGKIIGGTAKYMYNESTGKYVNGMGGAISAAGKIVMNGGIIEGGRAQAYIHTKDGNPVYERGMGGNVALSNATFEMNGGTIRNGRADNQGGNLFATGTTEITMNGGTISGGVTYGKTNGGNVHLSGVKVVLNMNGGTIYGGTSRNAGGAMYCNGIINMRGGVITGGKVLDYTTGKEKPTAANANLFLVNGTLNMTGGKIVGGAYVVDSSATDKYQARVILGGSAKITDSANGRNLTIATGGSGVKVKVNTLSKNAKIGVYATTGIFTEPTKEANKDMFYSDIIGGEINYYNNCLLLGRVRCLCGGKDGKHVNTCDGTELIWTPWYENNRLPTGTGNYYLPRDVVKASQTTMTVRNHHVRLDLNGKNITLKVSPSLSDGFRLYRADENTVLTITDTTDKPGTLKTIVPEPGTKFTGKIEDKSKSYTDEQGNKVTVYMDEAAAQAQAEANWKAGNFGMLLWARGGTINVLNGIFDGSNLDGTKNGQLFTANTMDVTDEATGKTTTYYGVINVYNAEIKGGHVTKGSNVHVAKGCTLNIYGGTFDGASTNGIGAWLSVEGTVNMTGGEITGGKALGGGGNVNVSKGKMTVSGNAKITDGEVLIGSDGKRKNGGNIYVAKGTTFTVSGDAVISGGVANIGGNIINYGHTIIEDGVIRDGLTKNGDAMKVGAGMNIETVDEGHLDIRGGTIAGGVFFNCFGSGEPRLSLSGAPVIDRDLTTKGVTKPAYSLDYRNTKTGAAIAELIDVSGLKKDAKIRIKATDYEAFAKNANADLLAAFQNDDGTEVAYNGGLLYTRYVEGQLSYCVCGMPEGKHTQYTVNGQTVGCDGTELKWKPWDLNKSLPTTGVFYLDTDVEVSSTTGLGGKVVLDLNGHTLTIKGSAMAYSLSGTGNLTITNTKSEGGIVNTGTSRVAYGSADTTINLYNVDVNMTSVGDTGGLFSVGGTLNIYGNTVLRNGKTAAGKNGGNLYIGGILNMYDGIIKDGRTLNLAGNIKLSGTLNMYGGLITGGKRYNASGDVDHAAGNIHIDNNGTAPKAILNMQGGKIDGDIAMYKTKTDAIQIGGTAQIGKGDKVGLELVAGQNILVTGALTGDASVLVTLPSSANPAAAPVLFGEGSGYTITADDVAKFGSTQGYTAMLESGKLYMTVVSEKVACVCGMPGGQHIQYTVNGQTFGCDAKGLEWTKWDDSENLPEAGIFYLDTDVSLDAGKTVSADLILDLNGHNVTFTGTGTAYTLRDTGSMIITNTDPTKGEIVYGGTSTFVYAPAGAKVDVYSTAFRATGVSTIGGGLFSVSGTMNIYGDTLISDGKTAAGKNGGNMMVNASGVVNMYDGEIKDGRTQNLAGNIKLSGTLKMYGGEITGGKKYSGTSTSAISSGNIHMDGASAKLIMQGGKIAGDIATYNTGADAIQLSGDAQITKGGNVGLSLIANQNIKVTGKLTGTEPISVKVDQAPTENAPVQFAEGSGYTLTDGDASKFESSQDYVVVRDGNKLYMKVINLTMGYARANITPSYSVPLGGYGNSSQRMSTGKLDDLYTTAIAINDGENTVIIIESDLQAAVAAVFNNVRQQVSQQTGIPVDNIMSAVDHVHSAPDLWNTAEASITQYTTELTNTMVSNAVAAYNDLKAVNIYVGATEVTGANFVRHYLLQDGNVRGPNFGQQYTSPVVGHTHDADNELQVVKFDRDGGDDIVLVNWQSHPQKVTGADKTDITADTVGAMRDYVEANSSYKFFYVLGASGDVAASSSIASENVHADYKAYGNAMGQQVVTILGGTMTQVKDGQIKTLKSTYTATVNKTENDKVEQARTIYSQWLQDNDTEAAVAAGAQYGINSPYHAKAIIQKYELAATQKVEVHAFAIGKLGFVFAPYEMFCENGAYIKTNSPFEKTIVCTMANDTYNYISAEDGFDYNCYEANTCRFVKGTGEALAEKYVSMLNELNGN